MDGTRTLIRKASAVATNRKSLAGVGLLGVGTYALTKGIRVMRARRAAHYTTPTLNPPSHPARTHTLTVSDGAILHVEIHGPADGAPIVFSHGWCERADYWNPQIHALSDSYRLITYDQRGHGSSILGERSCDITVLADDLAEVLRSTLNPGERAVLVGHSMGGMTIMSWAHRHPQQARRTAAVLLSATGYEKLIETSTMIPFIPAGALPTWAGRLLLGSRLPLPPLRMLRPIVKSRIMPSAGPDQIDFCARMFSSCPPTIRGCWGRALARLRLPGPNPIPNVPTTVLVGDHDHLTPPVHAQKIAAALADTGNLERLVILPGVGHEINIEAPEEFNAELTHLVEHSQRRRPSQAAG